MKTYKHVYPTVVSFENLYLAYRAAARGKRGQPNVAAFDLNLEDNLLRLQRERRPAKYGRGGASGSPNPRAPP